MTWESVAQWAFVFFTGAFAEWTGFLWVRWTGEGRSARVFILTAAQSAVGASGAYLYIHDPASIVAYVLGCSMGAASATAIHKRKS